MNATGRQLPSARMLSLAEKRPHLLALDVVKGISIIMVILTHVADVPQSVRQQVLWPFTILPAVPLFILTTVYAYSIAEDRPGWSIKSWFETKRFSRRFIRFFVPWIIIIVVQIVLLFTLLGATKLPLSSLMRILFLGGRGPGAYYVMLLFQILVFFPLMKYAFDQSPSKATVLFLSAQVAWEFLCTYKGISQEAYNILIPRFFSVLIPGFLAYRYADALKKTVIPVLAIVIGGGFLINTYYLGYVPVLAMAQWNRTFFAVLFPFGVFLYILRLEPVFQRYRGLLSPICYIGKASWHIMLTQMTYYYFARSLDFEARFASLWIRASVDVVISLVLGCSFYFLENIIRKLISNRKTVIASRK